MTATAPEMIAQIMEANEKSERWRKLYLASIGTLRIKLNEIERLTRLSAGPVITVKPQHLSGDRCDYFVSIKCGDREVTPHVFREQFKAEYEAAYYRWIFGQGDEPDLLAYSEAGWPSK